MDWPEHILPLPQQSSYSSTVDPYLAVTPFEYTTRQRAVFTNDVEDIQVTWIMSQFQRDYFKSFVRNFLNRGATPISISILGLDGVVRTEDVVFIGGQYTEAPHGAIDYRISARLRKVNSPTAPTGIVEYLASLPDVTPEGFTSLGDVLELYFTEFYGYPEGSPEILAFLESYAP